MAVTLSFFGGTRMVTGANYLFESNGTRVLIDCGLMQGCHFCERRNLRLFAYEPKDIDAVLLTHAHIDHAGRLPRLVQKGFSGPILATPPTRDFAELLLEDSADILSDEARERGIEPLYAKDEVRRTIERFEAVTYGEKRMLGNGVSVTFHNAGHVLGSSILELEAEGKIFVFSGDLGNTPTPLLDPPARLKGAEAVVIESTYGDRVHEDISARKQILEDAVEETVKSNGTLMIPAFAFERTQELLFELNYLVENKKLPRISVFVDSPLAIKITEVYKRHKTYYNKEAQMALMTGDGDPFRFPGLRMTPTVAESKLINDAPSPKVIIAGAGMLNGGRILHHARRYLSEPRNTLLITGFQAAGSLGRRLLDGEKKVKIFGEDVAVRAQIKSVSGYSAHADQPQLVAWINSFERPMKKVFVVQGEEGPALALTQYIRDHLGIDASAPMYGDIAEF